MPNFSFHLWRRSQPSEDFSGGMSTRCRESIDYHEHLFQRVNHLLEQIRLDESRKLAVFGLNERFALFYAYSQLGSADIECGLSDIEPYVEVDFPVISVERFKEFRITDVLLCVNQIHNDHVLRRLNPLGVNVHSFN
jgi:hypothetical protein